MTNDSQTPLDRAHLRAEATGAEGDRLAFWSRLAEAELHVVLTNGDVPATVEVEGTPHALAFDTALRLAGFAGAAPTATMAGRTLAALLAEKGLGLALNLEAPSGQLLGPEAMGWLSETLAAAPTEAMARIEEVGPPGDLPDALIGALDAKLPLAAGAARVAYLARARLEGGAETHVLSFVAPAPGAEAALAGAVQEALALSGVEAGTLDVIFPAASDPLSASLSRHGLRIELPEAPPRIAMGLGTEDAADGPPDLGRNG